VEEEKATAIGLVTASEGPPGPSLKPAYPGAQVLKGTSAGCRHYPWWH